MADVHKHAMLAWMLGYMTAKDKPLTYLESHAGRGLYDLSGDAARKTGEAAQGIARAKGWFGDDHPYTLALRAVRAAHGETAYPGSPLVAAHLLRDMDALILSELHPQEFAALREVMRPHRAICQNRDGWEMALSQTPPTPRRGLLLIDPSFEVKADYQTIPATIASIARKWPVGVIVLWYPVLTDNRHRAMVTALTHAHPDALSHEVRFPPARPGHGMVGSGLFVINPPYGLTEQAAWLGQQFAALT